MNGLQPESLVDYLSTEIIVQGDEISQATFEENASRLYREHAVECSPDRLRDNVKLILTGKKVPVLPSLFNGVLGSREGKKKAYLSFWDTVQKIHGNNLKRYIGLPANQILSIQKKANLVTVCEKKRKVFKWQKKLTETVKSGRFIDIYNKDIFRVLVDPKEFHGPWNIVDLDLMCVATQELVDKLNQALTLGAIREGKTVINLTTCIGRCISWKQYRELLPVALLDILVDSGFIIEETSSGKYRDRQVPVAYEHIVVSR